MKPDHRAAETSSEPPVKIFQGKDAFYYVPGRMGLRYGFMVHRWGVSVGG